MLIMWPSVIGAFSGLLWFAFAFTSANARVAKWDFLDTEPQPYNYFLEPRQDDSGTDSCTLPRVPCSSCRTCGGAFKNKRRYHLHSNVLPHADLYDTNFTLSEAIPRSENRLVKRVFEDVDQSGVGNYLQTQSSLPNVLGLDETYPNGTDISFARQLSFSDYITSNPPGLLMGTGQGYLTGCSVLTIVSRRAVYMGHFWQNLAFYSAPDLNDPDLPNLIENMLNLIGGQQPLYYAAGDALDVSLFNQPDDRPFAYLMAPRYRGGRFVPNPDPSQIFFDWPQIQQIGTYLQGLLPNLQAFLPIPYVAQKAYSKNQPWRGIAYFEYDPNADGNGNGNWRLFYEQTAVTGRSLGQDVVGVNNPGTTASLAVPGAPAA